MKNNFKYGKAMKPKVNSFKINKIDKPESGQRFE